MTAVLAAENAGMNPNDIQRVALGNLSGALTALENNVVEATSIPGILFLARGGESKYRVIVGPKDLPLLPPAVGIATGDLIKKNPQKLRAILAGRREAVKFLYSHTAEASKILEPIYAPLPPKDVDTLMQMLVDAKFYSEGQIEMPLLVNTVRAMKYVGMIDKDPDLVQDDRRLVPAQRFAASEMNAVARDIHAQLAAVTRVFPGAGNQPPVNALGPIDLDLRKGEFFAVVGPSGCGKSTFLEVLAGLQKPTAGTVTFEGKPVSGEVAEGIGVVFQEDASFPWLTVWDNAAFGLRRSGVAEAEIRRRVDDALAFMGLKDFARAYPSQLSGGMRQRVCISRTLVLQPRLILLDEPFGALDAQTRLLMGDEVLRLWRSTGATVLLITHALDEAAMLADRVGAMSARPGRFIEIIDTGWPRERDSKIVAEPAFGEITARLWDRLRGELLKALGHAGMTTTAAG